MPREDLVGKNFGWLTVIRDVDGDNGWRSDRCECKCLCGNIIFPARSNVRNMKSCGCKKKETSPINPKRHGDSYSRLYRIWVGMMQRCYNSRRHEFKNYGGRGIRVNGRWHDYENFKEDMAESYFEGATIERIDNDGGYSLCNCKWIFLCDQNKNKRNSLKNRLTDCGSGTILSPRVERKTTKGVE